MKKKQNTKEIISGLLEILSDDDLKSFLKEQMDNNQLLKQTFLAKFSHMLSNESQEVYNKQIKTILRTLKDRYGFISLKGARFAGSAVGDMLNTAYQHYNDDNYQSAVFIAFAVMEEMTEALQFAEDSNGDIGDNINNAFSLLREISDSEPPENIRDYIFNRGLKNFRNKTFAGWDWHLGMLETASSLINNEYEADEIISLLDSFAESEESDYSLFEAQSIKLMAIRNGKGIKEAEDFLEQNLQNPYFRKTAIQDSIDAEDYKKASDLALEGIRLDSEESPGYVNEWYDWLLKIAIAKGDIPEIIRHAKHLFLDSVNQKQDYYGILKKYTHEEEWNSFVENLVTEIRSSRRRGLSFEYISQIYIKEKWFDKLYNLLSEEPTLRRIEYMEVHLSGNYASQLAELYEPLVIDFMKNSKDRKDYRTACRYMKRMIALGAKEKVAMLVKKFRTAYPNRRALQEELLLVSEKLLFPDWKA
ncbi:MAG: hypothetical protein ACM3P0_00535 [Acidobacteriota bacterium]